MLVGSGCDGLIHFVWVHGPVCHQILNWCIMSRPVGHTIILGADATPFTQAKSVCHTTFGTRFSGCVDGNMCFIVHLKSVIISQTYFARVV